MKVKFEVEIPDYEVVDVPIYYETNIMKVSDKLDLVTVESVIEKALKIAKRDDLQNCDFNSVIYPVCLKIVGDDLRYLIIQSESVVEVAKNLGHLIMQFRNGTGWNYDDYKFEACPSPNGKKYKPKKFQMVFDTLEDYIVFYTESKISNKYFEYEVGEQ